MTTLEKNFSLIVHGGAGSTPKDAMAMKYREGLLEALTAASILLKDGGRSLDAVEVAVKVLEDNPAFNAGRGAVLNHKGEVELDASIMDGKSLSCGAVGQVQGVRNPISLARIVMEKTSHLLLVGEGALELAREHGAKFEGKEYFITEIRKEQLESAKQKAAVTLDHSAEKLGTVGAVACDIHGNLAAATSTGGMTNKRYGRLGDSCIIGAGTYAHNDFCAVSCTGVGEQFIRHSIARTVSALMQYKGVSLEEAVGEVVEKLIPPHVGGLIAVSPRGEMVARFNSQTLLYGKIASNEEPYLHV